MEDYKTLKAIFFALLIAYVLTLVIGFPISYTEKHYTPEEIQDEKQLAEMQDYHSNGNLIYFE